MSTQEINNFMSDYKKPKGISENAQANILAFVLSVLLTAIFIYLIFKK